MIVIIILKERDKLLTVDNKQLFIRQKKKNICSNDEDYDDSND